MQGGCGLGNKERTERFRGSEEFPLLRSLLALPLSTPDASDDPPDVDDLGG